MLTGLFLLSWLFIFKSTAEMEDDVDTSSFSSLSAGVRLQVRIF